MRPIKGISVDGGTIGNPGICFYRGVDISTGEVLFERNLGMGTNNIAEFLGLCHAINYVIKNNLTIDIYTDSVTALAWVRNKKHKSTFRGDVNTRLDSACDWLKTTKHVTPIKWITSEWGEIPADFGRK